MAMGPEITIESARWSADRLAWFEQMSGQPEVALTTIDRTLGLWDEAAPDDASRRSIMATRARALHELERSLRGLASRKNARAGWRATEGGGGCCPHDIVE